MVSITQSQRWRQQPAGATQIDRNHPLARGLVFAAIGNMPYAQEMVGGKLLQPLGTSTAKTFSTGAGLYSPSNVGNGWYANYDQSTFRTISNEFTIACEFAAESIGDTSHIVSAPFADGTFVSPKTSFCLRRVTTTSTMMIEIGTTSATEISATFSNAMISDGQKGTYVAVRSGSTASLRRDNVLMTQAGSSLTSGGNVGYSTASHICLLNRSATSLGNGTGGGILWTYIWNRALTDQEQQDIYYNPYEIVLPVDRTRFYLAAVPDEYSTEFTSEFDAGLVKEYSFEFTSEFDSVFVNSGACALIAPVESLVASGIGSIPAISGACVAIAPLESLISTGSVTNPAAGTSDFSLEFSSEFSLVNEYTLEYTYEFGFQNAEITPITGISVLIGKISSVVSSGARTIPTNTGNSSIVGVRDSISSIGSRAIPARSGNSVLKGPSPTGILVGSRTIPDRIGASPVASPKATLISSGTRSAVAVSGTSALLAPPDRVATAAASTIPARSGSSILIAPPDTSQTTATRQIPLRSGSSALSGPKPSITASQTFGAFGASSLAAPVASISIAGSRTIPERSGSAAIAAKSSTIIATGSRTVPTLSGSSLFIAPKTKLASFATDSSTTDFGVFLSGTCANLMLSALGQTLDSGFIRIYSGAEPSTAISPLSGNTLLAELRFGTTAFSAPVPVGSSQIITANLITGDSSADNDGIATFFRAFRNDSETIIWQGSAGDDNELILTSSGSNPYNIVKGGPVNVLSLTVAISLF